MSVVHDHDTIDLATGKLLHLRDAAGLTVEASHGIVWITLTDDERDVILEAGQSFTIDRPGLTLVSAMGDASIELSRAEFAEAA